MASVTQFQNLVMKMDEEQPIECKIIFSISNLQQGADLGSVDPKEANKSSEKY